MFPLAGIAGLGQLGMGIAGLFGKGGKNPAEEANKYLDQIPGMTQGYYSPYQQAGLQSLGHLQTQYSDLLGGKTQDRLGAGYKESPGYKRAMEQAMRAGTNASASGGMLGTPMHQEQNMELAGDIASKDYENYLRNQMGLYGLGLQGEQGLNQMGYGANTDFANLLANIQQQKAGYSYAGQAGQNQQSAGNWKNIFGGLGMFGNSGNNEWNNPDKYNSGGYSWL